MLTKEMRQGCTTFLMWAWIFTAVLLNAAWHGLLWLPRRLWAFTKRSQR